MDMATGSQSTRMTAIQLVSKADKQMTMLQRDVARWHEAELKLDVKQRKGLLPFGMSEYVKRKGDEGVKGINWIE